MALLTNLLYQKVGCKYLMTTKTRCYWCFDPCDGIGMTQIDSRISSSNRCPCVSVGILQLDFYRFSGPKIWRLTSGGTIWLNDRPLHWVPFKHPLCFRVLIMLRHYAMNCDTHSCLSVDMAGDCITSDATTMELIDLQNRSSAA